MVVVEGFYCIVIDSADEESLYKCPDRLRLPLIFYLAHPASVYVNKLMLAGLLKVHKLLGEVGTELVVISSSSPLQVCYECTPICLTCAGSLKVSGISAFPRSF